MNLKKKVWDQVKYKSDLQVCDQINLKVFVQVYNRVWGRVRWKVWYQVWEQVKNLVF
jgi:hypothetical protein